MVIKLRSVIIENVKNVEYGKIDFYNKNGFLNVTGIYGQNGSGKTTLVDVLAIVQRLLQGESLSINDVGMLNNQLEAKVFIEIEEIGQKILQYQFFLKKQEDEYTTSIQVIKEIITTKVLEKYKSFRKLVEYSFESEGIIQFNRKEELIGKEALEILEMVSQENRTSFLFNGNFSKRIEKEEKLNELGEAIHTFKEFAQNLRIYTSEYAGLISANIVAPVGIHYKKGKEEIRGLLPFHLRGEEGYVPRRLLSVYQRALKQMNLLLPEIIPGLTIEMLERDVRLGRNNEEEIKLEFLSNREGRKFSLYYESDGIKKIIGVISYLVEVYNNPSIIAIIDELDSGIYEYLLGELIEVMSTGAKGQLIFTSHNLRVLEVLSANKILFSTANPKNRYIRMKGIKRTNNLRDLYLRSVQLGGQEETLYQGKSSASLRIALMRAGVIDD